jgi:hypothetical protein
MEKKIVAKAKAEEKAPEPKKVLTPVKKADVKAEQAPANAEETQAAAAPVQEQKIERPTMPDNFCMEQSDWEGTGVCYDESSNNCKTCLKDFPETAAICKARADFLGIAGKAGKAKSSKTKPAKANKAPGKAPQSIVIDGYIKDKKTLEEMTVLLAERDFGGNNNAGKAGALRRIDSHLKAINTGTYCRAAEMKPHVAYLTAPAAPAAAPEKK